MKTSLGAKTLLYPTPTLLVGTYDGDGRPNLMTVAWGGICCSKPPCLTISVRKATYTYNNLVERKAFTVSLPSEMQVEQADYLGVASGRDVNKFEAAGLTVVRSDLVDAPYPDEMAMVVECTVVQVHDLGLHQQFIGEIADVKIDEDCVGPDGQPLIERLRPLVYAPGESRYYAIGAPVAKAFSVGRRGDT
jgi:flavin reductase (DIM6/NTAB) family NADH-FMN oxidoreductase RutF